ncbi:four helix bundle protein [Niastella caeni]|uniref:Four helix bundle protein n=1 Tax=Niastella caeni TaxID=2569763 RepID=A0A4S8I0Z8_9BACT|nr:four helix bundle protein [Niastella caeni]
MFIPLNHKTLDVYKAAHEMLLECYIITRELPPEEKFVLVSQIRRASLSVKLNIAEGASRKSTAERKRFYEVARSSVVEIDSAVEAVVDIKYVALDNLQNLGILLNRCFSMLCNMIS